MKHDVRALNLNKLTFITKCFHTLKEACNICNYNA